MKNTFVTTPVPRLCYSASCKNEMKWMIGVLGHDSEMSNYTGPGTTWVNEMNFEGASRKNEMK